MICPSCCGSGQGARHTERAGSRNVVEHDPCARCAGLGEIVQPDAVLCIPCIRCDAYVPLPTEEQIAEAVTIAHCTRRLPKGCVMMRGEGGVADSRIRVYCEGCAESLQICRCCGRTDEIGGMYRCHWIEENLCSQCKVERAA